MIIYLKPIQEKQSMVAFAITSSISFRMIPAAMSAIESTASETWANRLFVFSATRTPV